jgi:hypothetical protein
MKKNQTQKQANPINEVEFENILEGFLKVKPIEKKKPVKKEKSKPKK